MAKQEQIIAFQSKKRQAKIGVFPIHTALLPDKSPMNPDTSGQARAGSDKSESFPMNRPINPR